MSTPKFKIGQEIFFMNFSEPKKDTIKGTAAITGDFNASSFSLKTDKDTISFVYSTGKYSYLTEDKAFATKEELIDSLFSGDL